MIRPDRRLDKEGPASCLDLGLRISRIVGVRRLIFGGLKGVCRGRMLLPKEPWL